MGLIYEVGSGENISNAIYEMVRISMATNLQVIGTFNEKELIVYPYSRACDVEEDYWNRVMEEQEARRVEEQEREIEHRVTNNAALHYDKLSPKWTAKERFALLYARRRNQTADEKDACRIYDNFILALALYDAETLEAIRERMLKDIDWRLFDIYKTTNARILL